MGHAPTVGGTVGPRGVGANCLYEGDKLLILKCNKFYSLQTQASPQHQPLMNVSLKIFGIL